MGISIMEVQSVPTYPKEYIPGNTQMQGLLKSETVSLTDPIL